LIEINAERARNGDKCSNESVAKALDLGRITDG